MWSKLSTDDRKMYQDLSTQSRQQYQAYKDKFDAAKRKQNLILNPTKETSPFMEAV